MTQSQNEGKKMLTVEQVAREMNVDKKTVRKWINQGELRAVNIGHVRPEYRISRKNLNIFKRRRETGPKDDEEDQQSSFSK